MPHPKAFGIAFTLVLLPATAFAQGATPQTQTQLPEARTKVRDACAAEIQKFCANIERAKGAMRGCLEANAAQLSDGCGAARVEREAARARDKS